MRIIRLYFTVRRSSMKIFSVLFVMTFVSLALAEQIFEIDGIGYWISDPIQKKWPAAFRHCYQLGMYLIDFETAEEFDKVKEYLRSHLVRSGTSFWTSGTAVGTKGKSEFYWAITGSSLQFNGFGPGKPDNLSGKEHCVEMQQQLDFGWNDTPCREAKSFICRATRYFKLEQKISADPI